MHVVFILEIKVGIKHGDVPYVRCRTCIESGNYRTFFAGIQPLHEPSEIPVGIYEAIPERIKIRRKKCDSFRFQCQLDTSHRAHLCV